MCEKGSLDEEDCSGGRGGGKMGFRAVMKLRTSEYEVLACEKEAARIHELQAAGLQVHFLPEAIGRADFVVLAVPDELIGKLSHELVPTMKEGAALIALDAAAGYAGETPRHEHITQIIAHPCHPPFFTDQQTPAERLDYFGGTAPQDLVVSLVEGDEGVLMRAVELCRSIFAPVRHVHRVTPEQFALLEPAMSELVMATAAQLMKESLEEVIARGVPPEAAYAFAAGHVRIALAIAFGAEKSPFSDAAKIAVRWGMSNIIREDWRKVFEPETLQAAIQTMLHPQAQAPQ